ncbi:peroxisome biogenesis protein 16 [Gossypium arboreum]|uniref:peroxisome biogenesis protein 16 n=1 Tax=Gossypium arboreum TaxID=29729 RepID=UPI0022F1DCEA|nr:peroxisome biogenesis protein 16 [Gossypium arboreum]
MEAYKTWVRRNKDYVHSLQSLANGLTWLLPERFSNSQIGPEAVTATLGTLTAINEHIIDTAPEESHTGLADPLSFPYGLYISALKDLGTLVEVVAEQYYGDKRWSFIAVRKLPTSTIERRTLSMILSEKCVNGAIFILGKVLFITRPLRDIL